MTYTIVGVYTCHACGQFNTGCRECWNRHRARCGGPRSVPSPRRWTRAVVGDDVYLDLLSTIDPGDDDQ